MKFVKFGLKMRDPIPLKHKAILFTVEGQGPKDLLAHQFEAYAAIQAGTLKKLEIVDASAMGSGSCNTVPLFYKVPLEVEDDDQELAVASTDLLANVLHLKNYLNYSFPNKIKHPMQSEIYYQVKGGDKLIQLKPSRQILERLAEALASMQVINFKARSKRRFISRTAPSNQHRLINLRYWVGGHENFSEDINRDEINSAEKLKQFILQNCEAGDGEFKFDVLFHDPNTGTQHNLFTEEERYIKAVEELRPKAQLEITIEDQMKAG